VPADRAAFPAVASPAARPVSRSATRRTWLALGAVAAVALLLRIGYLIVLYRDGFVWPDVDRYLANGASLVASGRFRWTFDAVAYSWGGRIYALPPLYSLYLAPFALFPASYPFNALVGLAILNAAMIPVIAALGARLHSMRAGVAAAVLYACWGADVAAFAAIRQEALYIPLVIVASYAVVRAWDGDGGRFAFPLAGAAFGLAALCRSMPIYFVAALTVAIAIRGRGAGWRQALAFAGGFAALTAPYSLALSIHLGKPTLIENHGGILVAHRYVTGGNREVPAFTTVVAAILGQIVSSPAGFVGDTLDQARSLLHVSGGRYLQEAVYAASARGAWAWKALVHLAIDLPWVLALVLAPLGAVLARSPAAAAMLGGWALLNIGLTAITGFGGSRLRGPFEIHLVLLAAVVLAGPWVVRRRWVVACGLAASIGLAVLIAPQVERSLEARGNYGARWSTEGAETRASVAGASGANVLAAGTVAITVSNPGAQRITVDLRVDGTPLMDDAGIDPGQDRLATVPYGPPALAFVEVQAVGPDGRPATADVRVQR
jgi:hypothetical protein